MIEIIITYDEETGTSRTHIDNHSGRILGIHEIVGLLEQAKHGLVQRGVQSQISVPFPSGLKFSPPT